VAAHLRWVWDAYAELSTCRHYGAQRIPWDAIHAYAVAHAIRDEDRFVRLVRGMENAMEAAARGD
jgi:hypothetical protein